MNMIYTHFNFASGNNQNAPCNTNTRRIRLIPLSKKHQSSVPNIQQNTTKIPNNDATHKQSTGSQIHTNNQNVYNKQNDILIPNSNAT